MPLTYEISRFESNMPIRCYIHHIGTMPKHSHEMFEIVFILSGECNLIMDDHLYQLHTDDIFIIEDFLPHELRANDCVYATIQLDRTRLESTFPNPIHPTFECNSQIPGKEEAFDALRRKIAQIIKNNADKPFGYELKNWIFVYELMELLFINFRVERSAALEKKNHRYAERVYEISKIIKEHYTEDLTLSALADMMHLSVPYLSKFFMEHFGVNYLTYLTQLRIKNAEYELSHTEKNIETIAADCGFPNGNAFTAAFKKEYGMLPSAYRRNIKQQSVASVPIEYHDYMSSLKKYLVATTEAKQFVPSYHIENAFSAIESKQKLRHTWSRIVSVGQAADLLLSDVQAMLSQAQKALSYDYVFFNGILSDNLYLYQLNIKGEATYNFAYVDRIFDFLLSIHLKPMLSFSYMPRDLAKNPDHYLFNHLVSEPKSMDLWCQLIQTFMSHMINRYGLSEIRTWRFSVWHQPNTPSRLFGFSDTNFFYEFYKTTRAIVKDFSSDIAFGLPCMYYLDEQSNEDFILSMTNWCKNNQCIPDYFNYTFYDVSLDHSRNKTKDSFGFVDAMTLNPNSDGLKQAISAMIRIRRASELESLPIYISEWNNTPSQQDYLNDTCFKSCYIAKNILENYDRIDGLSYWALTDLMAEHALPAELFFGGLGLFTLNGIPKASYYAMMLLHQLGDDYLMKGEHWFATKKEDEIRIIAYNYKHYTQLYSAGERFDMTRTDRYTMFEPSTDLNLTLSIRDLNESKYQVKEYILNRNHGSSFDSWRQSGGVEFDSLQDFDYLKAISKPLPHFYYKAPIDHTLTLEIKMQVLEVRLITIKEILL